MSQDTQNTLYTVYFCSIGNQMKSKVKSLCGSEVTSKIEQLEVEGGTCPSAP